MLSLWQLIHPISLVYYRIYAEDGAIPSANPVYTDDLYLGRISPILVTPPLTARNLKLCLSGVENIDEEATTRLFLSASSQAPVKEDSGVSIFAYPGPGCQPSEPMALVVKHCGTGRTRAEPTEADRLPPQEGTTPFESQYGKYLRGLFIFAIP